MYQLRKSFCSVLCSFSLLFSVFGMTALCAQESGQTEDNSYLASYLVNWDEMSHQFANCQTGQSGTGHETHDDGHFLLGSCPSINSINTFYAGTALIHYAAANLLPEKYGRLLTDSSVNFQVSLFKEHTSLAMSMNF